MAPYHALGAARFGSSPTHAPSPDGNAAHADGRAAAGDGNDPHRLPQATAEAGRPFAGPCNRPLAAPPRHRPATATSHHAHTLAATSRARLRSIVAVP